MWYLINKSLTAALGMSDLNLHVGALPVDVGDLV